jgi:3-isopropylmalate/(R)-2-methylmalate dehydratase small subunit
MPQPFRSHTGIVAPLDRSHVDTDQIVPKQFLKRVERTGFGQFLFHDWAHLPDGQPNPAFLLNQPAYRQATILAAGANFGCGSSREHAPWALADFGFRALLAPSFADIFSTNCFKNGLLAAELPETAMVIILARAQAPGYTLTVDLETCRVADSAGLAITFPFDPFRRHCLLHALDEIALTLQHEVAIGEREAERDAVPSFLPAGPA